jgi:hypothetical protein
MKIFLETSGIAILTLADGTEIEGHGTLAVRERGGMKDGQGTFRSDAPEIFRAIQESEALSLEFADGVKAKVIVTRSDMAGLQFVTTGPVTMD